jgi:hypothetical protein
MEKMFRGPQLEKKMALRAAFVVENNNKNFLVEF